MKRALLSLAVAALLLAVVLHRVDLPAALAALHDVRLPLLAAALVVQAAALMVKAHRWGTTLCVAAEQPVRGVLSASLIGFATNLVLPARLGEIPRAHLAAADNRLPRSLVLTTVALTQLLDLLVLGTLLLGATFLLAPHRLLARPLPAALLATGLTVLLLLRRAVGHHPTEPGRRSARGEIRRGERGACAERLLQSQCARAVLSRLAARLLPAPLQGTLRYYAGQARAGLQLLGNRRAGAAVLLETAAAWGLEIVSLTWALIAFRIFPAEPQRAQATFLAPATLLGAVLNLAFCFPLTPANLGPHQFLSVLVLGLFGVRAERAVAFSLGYQAASAVLVVGLGVVALMSRGLSLGALCRQLGAARKQRTEPYGAAPASRRELDIGRLPSRRSSLWSARTAGADRTANDADGTVPGPEGAVSATGSGDSDRAAGGLSELHLCPRTDGQEL